MAITIKYNGKTTVVESGSTAVLSCKGEVMKSDVEIYVPREGASRDIVNVSIKEI